MLTTGNESIPFRVEKTTHLTIGDAGFNSGCSVMEVDFPAHISSKIGFIKFKNNYVASLSVRLKYRQTEGNYTWRTVLKNYPLMPSPHHECASQSSFTIDAEKQFTENHDNVVAVRLILRQPSPHWSHFGLDDLTFYLPNKDHKSKVWSMRKQIYSDGDKRVSPEEQHIDEKRVSQISEKFHKAVSLASDERVVNSLEKNGSIRFDVDGSYDLNLLSYS